MSRYAAVKSKNFSRIISNLKWLPHFSTFSRLKEEKYLQKQKKKFRILLLYFYQAILSPLYIDLTLIEKRESLTREKVIIWFSSRARTSVNSRASSRSYSRQSTPFPGTECHTSSRDIPLQISAIKLRSSTNPVP